MWSLLFFWACSLSARRIGLVEVSATHTTLIDPSGKTFQLISTPQTREIDFLDGFEVEVQGRRFGSRLTVVKWAVVNTVDGSTAYIGTLGFVGGEWILQDADAGIYLKLVPNDPSSLYPYLNKTILVTGFSLGNERAIQIADWRPLSEPTLPQAEPE